MNSRPIHSVADATAYLDGLINYEKSKRWSAKNLGLASTRALLQCVGNPERKLSFIHIAGSKGKGSTCLFVESILLALGEKVGTFTSPHLVSWVERFRVGGQPVDDHLVGHEQGEQPDQNQTPNTVADEVAGVAAEVA